jgi:hypothetical protein
MGTNGTPEFYIAANGDIGIGTVLPTHDVHLIHASGGPSEGLKLEHTSSGEDWGLYTLSTGDLYLYNDGLFRGDFDGTSGTYTPVSDARLKTNVEGVGSVLAKVGQLKPSTYNFIADAQGKRWMGFMAQDVEVLFPELVKLNHGDDGSEVYTMDYAGMSVVAIKAIQELTAEIEQLRTRISELESR